MSTATYFPCPCCVDDCTSGCSRCFSTCKTWTLTVAGVGQASSLLCPPGDCTKLNGTFTLRYRGGCNWTTDEAACGNPCWQLEYDAARALWRVNGASAFCWSLPAAAFDCFGPNTLPFNALLTSSADCNNLPATVTVTPFGCPGGCATCVPPCPGCVGYPNPVGSECSGLTLTVAGLGDGSNMGLPGHCPAGTCGQLNGTFVLKNQRGGCLWQSAEVGPCGGPAWQLVYNSDPFSPGFNVWSLLGGNGATFVAKVYGLAGGGFGQTLCGYGGWKFVNFGGDCTVGPPTIQLVDNCNPPCFCYPLRATLFAGGLPGDANNYSAGVFGDLTVGGTFVWKVLRLFADQWVDLSARSGATCSGGGAGYAKFRIDLHLDCHLTDAPFATQTVLYGCAIGTVGGPPACAGACFDLGGVGPPVYAAVTFLPYDPPPCTSADGPCGPGHPVGYGGIFEVAVAGTRGGAGFACPCPPLLGAARPVPAAPLPPPAPAAVGPAAHPAPVRNPARPLPCLHLGPVIDRRDRGCTQCWTRACDKFGSCTQGDPSAGLPVCATCPAYEADG